MAQSVVLETGPQPTPSTAIFAFTPASLQRASYHRSCQEKNLCQLWSGEAGPRTSTPAAQPPSGIPEQLRLWPLPHPVLTSATASSPLLLPCTSRACVCCLLLFCSLAPFWSAFAFCWGESHSPWLLSHLSLTLRWEVSKLQEQDESSTFRLGAWEFEAFLGPTAAYCTPPNCTRDWRGRIVTSVIYIPAGELCPATLSSLKEGAGRRTHPSLGL